MRKRICGLLAALALCLGLLPGTALAAGTPTRTEPLDLRGFVEPGTTEENSAEGWRWEVTSADSGTLTLTDCYIQSSVSDVILLPLIPDGQNGYVDFTTTIILNGHNILESSSTAGRPMVYSKAEDGKTDDSSVYYVIQGSGDLEIKAGGMAFAFGAGTITINSGTITSNVCFCTILNDFTMKDGSLAVTGVDVGIYTAYGPINIIDGSVDINVSSVGIYTTSRDGEATRISGGVVKITSVDSYPIYNTGGSNIISGGAVVLDKDSGPSAEKQDCLLLIGDAGQVYGNAVLTRDLTIPEGTTVTIPADASLSFAQGAVLTNEGTVKIENGDAITDIPAYIRNLNLGGDGKVVVEKSSGGSGVEETYTNEGKRLLEPAGTSGELDLSSAKTSDTGNWGTQGYKWDNIVIDPASGEITSATLTLAEGFNAEKIVLPDATVTIETEGDCTIGTLGGVDPNGSGPQHTKVIFSGQGTPVIQRIRLDGGNGNSLTVAADAHVIVGNGISGGASGVDFSITVNGTLTVTQGDGSGAIYAGRVAVGDKGVLEVSGEQGVLLHGMTEDGTVKFNNLFTVAGDGRFTADCSDCNVRVETSGSFPDGTTAAGAIHLTPEYMPDDCEVRLDGTNIDLIRISTDEVYSGALTIHKNHVWDTAWTDGGEDNHYHACIYKGCTEKNNITPHYYAHGATACRDCGHSRPEGAPDSDGGGSGDSGGSSGSGGGSGSSGGGSGGSGGSSGSSGHGSVATYAVTVEKAEHGKVASSHTMATGGSTVTLTATPSGGYELDALTVTDSRGDAVKLTEKNGRYAFTMPSRSVTVRARFASVREAWTNPYSDVAGDAWYYEAVRFAGENGLMSGYGNGLFGPDNPLTRAQFVQILYNKEGRPAVTGSRRFTDVAPGGWCADAVAWAAERGVAGGYGDGRFRPGAPVTREQLAVMLWRYAGSPAADQELPFRDAGQAGGYAREALCWAAESGVMSGRAGGLLDPKGLATRAQAAQMLKNFLENR